MKANGSIRLPSLGAWLLWLWRPWSDAASPYIRDDILLGIAVSETTSRAGLSATTIGALCGVGAAVCWALGFVVAKHGIAIGFLPADLAFHRFVWSGLLLVPVMARAGFADLGGVGWTRGLVILVLAGPLQALISYTGFTYAPLGHGAVIHRRARPWAG